VPAGLLIVTVVRCLTGISGAASMFGPLQQRWNPAMVEAKENGLHLLNLHSRQWPMELTNSVLAWLRTRSHMHPVPVLNQEWSKAQRASFDREMRKLSEMERTPWARQEMMKTLQSRFQWRKDEVAFRSWTTAADACHLTLADLHAYKNRGGIIKNRKGACIMHLPGAPGNKRRNRAEPRVGVGPRRANPPPETKARRHSPRARTNSNALRSTGCTIPAPGAYTAPPQNVAEVCTRNPTIGVVDTVNTNDEEYAAMKLAWQNENEVGTGRCDLDEPMNYIEPTPESLLKAEEISAEIMDKIERNRNTTNSRGTHTGIMPRGGSTEQGSVPTRQPFPRNKGKPWGKAKPRRDLPGRAARASKHS
jgi:hypothetical protein